LSIDTVQDSQSVVNTLDMAISLPTVRSGGIVHADHGVQFTSWIFSEKGRPAGVIPSLGSIGDAFDYSMMEFFWSSIENELPNREPGITRIELSNAIFE
jgi:transposase InsO family protein